MIEPHFYQTLPVKCEPDNIELSIVEEEKASIEQSVQPDIVVEEVEEMGKFNRPVEFPESSSDSSLDNFEKDANAEDTNDNNIKVVLSPLPGPIKSKTLNETQIVEIKKKPHKFGVFMDELETEDYINKGVSPWGT